MLIKLERNISIKGRLIAGVVFCCIVGGFAFLWAGSRGIVNLTYTFGECGFKQEYELPCPGCGVTTSCLAFVNGHFVESFNDQPAGGVLCCFFAAVGLCSLASLLFGVRWKAVEPCNLARTIKYFVICALIVLAGGWAVTMARAIAQRQG